MWTGLRKQETWKMHFCQQHFSTSRKLNNYFSRKLSTHKNNIFIAFLKNAADGLLFTLEKKKKKQFFGAAQPFRHSINILRAGLSFGQVRDAVSAPAQCFSCFIWTAMGGDVNARRGRKVCLSPRTSLTYVFESKSKSCLTRDGAWPRHRLIANQN